MLSDCPDCVVVLIIKCHFLGYFDWFVADEASLEMSLHGHLLVIATFGC